MSDRPFSPGITPAGAGQDEAVWNVLGHRYFLKAEGEACFCFETYDPPGTFVPLHVHPRQDEFTFDLQLGEEKVQAHAGDLVRMPRGIPHPTPITDRCRRAPCSGSRRPAG
jgi:quercetin dioxygenase-like cupin family protein